MNKLSYPLSLHNHTDFSNFRLRDSINTVESLIDYALELGHSGVAITEHDTIASHIRAEKYYNKIKKDHPKFKLIRGNEIYLVRNGLNGQNYKKETDRYFHFILLAKDAIGHEQIREISTRAWIRSYVARRMRRVPTYYQDLIDVIGKNPGHVIGSTACLGGCLPTQLIRNRDTGAPSMDLIKRWIVQMQGIFGVDDFYFEMQPSFNKDQIYVNKKLVELGEEMGIKYIITNDAHYLKKEDRPIHKAFLNSQQGDREVDDFYTTTFLMSDEEIYEYMEESLGEEVIQKAYQTIEEIRDKCEDYSLAKSLKIPRLNWKRYTVEEAQIEFWRKKIPYLDKFLSSEYKEDKHLAYAIIDRIKDDETLHNEETYNEINACLEDTWISSEVNGSRWSAYFLNLQNIIDACWDAGTLVGCGRGSGVGFILLYLLGITQINPLREKSQTKRWRFLNPERVSVLDVDIDIEGGRRAEVLKNFRKIYGEDRVANVLTLKTEKSKSAIQTACRGLGIDNDIAAYLSSFIQADRGQLRTLKQTFYGDPDNGMSASSQFRIEMEENYPEVWRVAQGIEGLINGCGIHAGGVIFVDEPFTESTALMRAPKGEIITQFDLHDAEATGLIKYDILSVEALDKIHNCIDLICKYGYEKAEPTLKETYEKIIGIYNLERDSQEMWKMCWEHKVMSLFQMEKQSGINGIAAMKPTSVDDLAILNSAIRLMATEKGGEMPVNKLARFKAHPDDWDYELRKYGLGAEAKKILEPVLDVSYGLCIAQEQFMQLVQLPELGGFDLTWADKLRKSIAKKNPAEYEKLTDEYFKIIKEKGLDERLCTYVWNVLIAMSKGYGFNLSHTLAYSLIGLQELNLAYRYPTILWDCACLISDSGGAEKEENDEDENESNAVEEYFDNSIGDFEDRDDDDEEDDGEEASEKKKKKTSKSANYGKIATAIGKMSHEGVTIVATNINKSEYTFAPDIENHRIIYGLSGITRVGDDLVRQIMDNRPYESIEDFISKIKINKPQMINLIKSGAFDDLYGGDRIKAMNVYIDLIADKKKRMTLQNLQMLINFNFIPEDYEFQCKVYNFNKYLKKMKFDNYYGIDNIALNFYSNNFDMDLLTPDSNYVFKIKQTDWDKIYKKQMDKIRPFIKDNNELLLEKVNWKLRQDLWDKYCQGNISQWEMDSISCYIHDHELKNLRNGFYGLSNFSQLPENPVVNYEFRSKETGQKIPLFKICRIAGTVLDKDKNKKMVTLLTNDSVVTVKIFGDAFTHYDRQISEKGADGVKHVKEKSWLSRGNKVIITGIRRDSDFIAKKYKNTPHHLVELITSIDENGYIQTKLEREEA
ncbi:MAG: DNA polymerase III subunit alpha [Oceanobacillus sp.]|nr:DNA polymerase III subunit alpha [Oceanobacillus sp.]